MALLSEAIFCATCSAMLTTALQAVEYTSHAASDLAIINKIIAKSRRLVYFSSTSQRNRSFPNCFEHRYESKASFKGFHVKISFV